MPLLYDFNLDSADDIAARLSENAKPAPTIAKFEQHHCISLIGFIALAKALGYTESLKSLLAEPVYTTMEELDTINRNKNRKRGRNEFDQ